MKGKTLHLVVAVALALGMLLVLPSPASRSMKGFVRDALAPYHALTASFGAAIRRRVDQWRARRAQTDMLDEMQAEVHRLRADALELHGLREENKALRRQLNYRSRADADLVACRVIARGDMTGWWRTLRINRGAADGIQRAMAVVSERGLVGRIEQTSRYTADVLLISDGSSRVSVRVMPSGTPGILEGAAPNLKRRERPHVLLPVSTFDVNFLSLRDEIRENDTVETSGLGGVFPAGLAVGTVARIREDPSGLYRRAEIVPAADFQRLETLYVVRQSRGGVARP